MLCWCGRLHMVSPHCFSTMRPRQHRCLPVSTEKINANQPSTSCADHPSAGSGRVCRGACRQQLPVCPACRWPGRTAQATSRGAGGVQKPEQRPGVQFHCAAGQRGRHLLGTRGQAAGVQAQRRAHDAIGQSAPAVMPHRQQPAQLVGQSVGGVRFFRAFTPWPPSPPPASGRQPVRRHRG